MKVLNRRVGNAKYILFIDLEGTQFSHEVISIGAVLGKIGKNGIITNSKKGFQIYVKAREKVNAFITDLTGITQETVDKKGVTFENAMKQLKKYTGLAWTRTKFVAFGFSDMLMFKSSLKHQPENIKTMEIVEQISINYIDFQAIFSQFIKDDHGTVLSLNNSLLKFGLTFEGSQHEALADATNLLRLYNAFQTQYDIITQEYRKVLSRNKKNSRPIAKILKTLNEGIAVTPEMYRDFIEEEIRD